jgi:hypothetical protein
MLAMLYPILQSAPFVAARDAVADPAAASELAARVNQIMWTQLLLTGGLSWLFWGGWHAWLCAALLRSVIRRRKVAALAE